MQSWIDEVKLAVWDTPNDIKQKYSTASFLKDNIVVFNIKGNKYRLVTKIDYISKIVFFFKNRHTCRIFKMDIRIGDYMPQIIINKMQYNAAMSEIEKLMDIKREPGSDEDKLFNLLVILVKNYKKDSKIRELPDPIEAIKFRMEQQGLKQRDLIPYIGSRSLVSEILSGKRNLTLEMVWALNEHLGIPLNVLSQKPKETTSSMLKAS